MDHIKSLKDDLNMGFEIMVEKNEKFQTGIIKHTHFTTHFMIKQINVYIFEELDDVKKNQKGQEAHLLITKKSLSEILLDFQGILINLYI